MTRGKRRNAQEGAPPEARDIVEGCSNAAKRQWARLIKQVYEADPLLCPRYREAMQMIAFIEQLAIIKKILTHLPACA